MSENGIRNDLKFLYNLVEKFNNGDSHLKFVSGFAKRIKNMIAEMDQNDILYHSLTKELHDVLEMTKIKNIEIFRENLETFEKVVNLCEILSENKFKSEKEHDEKAAELSNTKQFFEMSPLLQSLVDNFSELSPEIPSNNELGLKYKRLYHVYKNKYFYIHMAYSLNHLEK